MLCNMHMIDMIIIDLVNDIFDLNKVRDLNDAKAGSN